MKPTFLLFLILFVCATAMRAQIPNSGFEVWNASGNCLQPLGWACINDWLGDTQNCYSMSQSDDHYPVSVGSYSIKIENTPSVFPDLGAAGLVWTGDSSGFGTDQPAFPIIGHPTSLRGYYKFLPENGDTMDIHFALYKNGVEVTSGRLVSSTAVTNWTSFKIQVSSPDYPEADSARIMMSSFNAEGEMVYGNSVLYVDNLSFDNLIFSVGEKVTDNSRFGLYPSPAFNTVHVIFADAITDDFTLEIYCQSGVRVKSLQLQNPEQEINVSGLNPGVYLFVVKGTGFIGTQKLVVIRK
jgi:hypothetical protein